MEEGGLLLVDVAEGPAVAEDGVGLGDAEVGVDPVLVDVLALEPALVDDDARDEQAVVVELGHQSAVVFLVCVELVGVGLVGVVPSASCVLVGDEVVVGVDPVVPVRDEVLDRPGV